MNNACGSAAPTSRGILLCGTWPPEVGEIFFDGRDNRYMWDGERGVLQVPPRPRGRFKKFLDRLTTAR